MQSMRCFLAAAVDTKLGATVVDFGAGAGASSLCLAWRAPVANITGYEADGGLAELANRNAAMNRFSDRLCVLQMDVRSFKVLPEAAFDQVISNPPFCLTGSGTMSEDAVREKSLRLDVGDLADWVRSTAKVLRHHGRATFIFSAERLDLLIGELAFGFGGLRLFPLWQRIGLPAKRILIQARKGSRTPTTLLPGMALHTTDGKYTPEAEAVLRHGAAIDLGTG